LKGFGRDIETMEMETCTFWWICEDMLFK